MLALGLLAVFPLFACSAHADWQTSWDASVYLEAAHAQVRAASPLNPDNRLARLAETGLGAEARIQARLESETLRFSLRPILPYRWSDDGQDSGVEHAGHLSQWQARLVLGREFAASLGREVMNWGPAQFRSPSSPYYFDNGRSKPTRELSGVDNLKLAWTPDAQRQLSLAHVQDSGHLSESTDPWRNSWLIKGEQRGDDWAVGLALAQAPARQAFLGGYGQWTLDEAWLLYAEAASASQADALVSAADPGRPFQVLAESPRRAVALLGATRTLENGQGISLEYLYNGHGYDAAETRAYYARAAASPAAAGLALAFAPALLGRHYLHLVWQSNPLDDGDYWRLMWSRSLNDGGDEWAAYLDHPLDGRVSLYGLALLTHGGPRREFSSLLAGSLTLGVKLALP